MKTRLTVLCSILAILSVAAAAASLAVYAALPLPYQERQPEGSDLESTGAAPNTIPATAADLIVHEWGTFLAMQGSDGVTLDGMYHEEHALPAFVHARGRDQLHLPTVLLKGETPV